MAPAVVNFNTLQIFFALTRERNCVGLICVQIIWP